MAYTSDLSIRYYNFATNVDAQIPMGSSARDLLSDISGSKIVFSRVITGKTTVMVFDASTPAVPPVELNPANGVTRIGSAIGNNTVAYIDFTLENHGELFVHDLVTNISTRLTNDVAYDANPSVASNGDVVTWEHCATSSSNCDVWRAVKSGGVWSAGPLASSSDPEANPDTNASIVVYDSTRNGNADIFWKADASGSETKLQWSGFEANPSISQNFILFESRPTLFDTTDLYIYDRTTNLLYRMTDTPVITEQLNDVSVLPDGRIRLVWTSDEDGFDQRNIRSATFSLSPPDVIPPVVETPGAITANATSSAGAVVTYTVQATDNVGVVSLVCVPPSGSVFAIGTTTVQCTARDAAGNTGTGVFRVRVKGAPEQILDLAVFVGNTPMPVLLKLRLLTALAVAFANQANKTEACAAMSAFVQIVQTSTGIPAAAKNQMLLDANRIRAVLGCT